MHRKSIIGISHTRACFHRFQDTIDIQVQTTNERIDDTNADGIGYSLDKHAFIDGIERPPNRS
ncbi:hypothetical protein DPV79_40815 [Burkholderia reimsis]|uniref:Uncharacterized protein n=1 Tax=Burkholderia reimsis TaxID=2234132 RepID=A0A365QGJ6_9BURK|nr:hypothetical protein DPV79_40815 [Burkholderia reimsis]